MSNATEVTGSDEIIELSVLVDSEAAEAVSELFNRYNGGGYEEDSEAGEASGGGAVIEATGFDDEEQYYDAAHRFVVKTYIKPGARGAEIRRQIEDGLWRLSLIYPDPSGARCACGASRRLGECLEEVLQTAARRSSCGAQTQLGRICSATGRSDCRA